MSDMQDAPRITMSVQPEKKTLLHEIIHNADGTGWIGTIWWQIQLNSWEVEGRYRLQCSPRVSVDGINGSLAPTI